MAVRFGEVRSLLLIPILLLCWLSFITIQWGVADLRIGFAGEYFDQWSKQKSSPTVEDWQRVHSTLLKAEGLTNSDHPDVKELLGKLYLVGSGLKKEPEEYIINALQYYQQAAALRPVSPYPWAIIALIQHTLGRYDADFDYALSQASYYGHWNPDTLLVITEIAFSSNESALSLEARSRLNNNVSRAIVVQRAKVIALAKKYGVVETLCHQYLNEQKPGKLCN